MITVVLPAFNEQRSLPVLLDRLADVSILRFGSKLRVVVVDDGSTDDTALAATDRQGLEVRLIAHESNRGLGAAIETALRAALDSAACDDIVVTMDADDTHTPWLIPRMVEQVREGNDVVVASRFQPGSRVIGVPKRRQLLSHGMSLLFRLVYPVPGARDFSCGFRAYRAGVLSEAFERWGESFVSESGFACMVDILIKLSATGAIVAEAPLVLRYDRKRDASKLDARNTVRRTLTLLVRRRLGMFD